ncbi:MAG: hypothetical protein J3K34DRAFT_381029, partial [Monoraphidium minutum]
MFSWKVVDCPFEELEHDWGACPFAHEGEKARRRSPATHPYQAACCPDVRRRGRCPRGDSCPFAHSVFELHLHPAKFRIKMCRDGTDCTRKICFFAHSPPELRTPSPAPAPSSAGALPKCQPSIRQQPQQQPPALMQAAGGALGQQASKQLAMGAPAPGLQLRGACGAGGSPLHAAAYLEMLRHQQLRS